MAAARNTCYVPTGATQLGLGINECTTPGPGCYSDNLGRYTVGYSVNGTFSQVPEPSARSLRFRPAWARGRAQRVYPPGMANAGLVRPLQRRSPLRLEVLAFNMRVN